jgi:nuclear transport factor 2 (NTF2) superfamily protein
MLTFTQHPCSSRAAPAFEQEPDALFGFVEPVFDHTHACHIIDSAADDVRFAHKTGQPLVVAEQFGEHQRWRDHISFVSNQAGQTHDVLHRSVQNYRSVLNIWAFAGLPER